MDRVLLTIAGSDSGGGAGIQADLRAFWDHGWHGASVITAVTAQHTLGVTRVDVLPESGVVAQLQAVQSDLDVAAVKIGMLGTASVIEAVAGALSTEAPIVLDPVMVATSGDRLLDDDAVAALVVLARRATIVTPNLPEAAVLAGALGVSIEGLSEALGTAVLVTGGDAEGSEVVDTLLGQRIWRLPRVAGGPFHGTGCTLSSALAARLGAGEELLAATGRAIAYVRGRLATAQRIGGGASVLGPVTP